jgi:phytanoyl-CoA hydroxylase
MVLDFAAESHPSAKQDDVAFFEHNDYLLHRSLPNRANGGYRRALVNHYMSAESLLPWTTPAEGEFVSVHDFRDIVMIAGQDPYGYKGIDTLSFPHIRPSGEGGCKVRQNKNNPD